jgi:hypothetical protein
MSCTRNSVCASRRCDLNHRTVKAVHVQHNVECSKFAVYPPERASTVSNLGPSAPAETSFEILHATALLEIRFTVSKGHGVLLAGGSTCPHQKPLYELRRGGTTQTRTSAAGYEELFHGTVLKQKIC